MTTARSAGRRAAKQGYGQCGISNAAGAKTGPGSSAESRSKKDSVRSIAGAGFPETARNRPGQRADS